METIGYCFRPALLISGWLAAAYFTASMLATVQPALRALWA